MLKAVADVLAQQAAQMIATYIAIGIARAFAGFAGGGGKELNLAGVEQYSGIGANMITPFAEGDYVSGPTNFGRRPVNLSTLSLSRRCVKAWRVTRVVLAVLLLSLRTGRPLERHGMGGGTAVAAPIDVRYTVERINALIM